MFCPKCGNEVQEGSAFCGNCGAGIAGKVPNTAGVATAAATVATTKAGKKKGPIAIVAAIVVVAIAVVIGVNVLGGASGVAVKDSTEAYTWEELSKISEEIGRARDEGAAVEIAKKYNLTTKDGKLDGTQTKSVTLSNGMQTAVQIVGFAHDDKTDGGKAGITFIFKDCIGTHVMNSNDKIIGGWEKSQMRSYLNSEGLNLLPVDLKREIVAVNKLTNNVGETQSVSSVTTTSDQLWLFSHVELAGYESHSDYASGYGYVADVFNSEGARYKLYDDMGVNPFSSNDILVKNYQSSSYDWWERSPVPSGGWFMYVTTIGDLHYGRYPGNSFGVVPGFCI